MSDVEWIKRGLSASGKSQAELARRMGLNPSAVTRLLKGERTLLAREVPVIERFLGVEAPDAVRTLDDGGRLYAPDEPAPRPSAPCYASRDGGAGVTVLYMNEPPVSSEMKPPRAVHIRGIYAFAAVGDAMMPRFKPGEIVWVNPHRQPRPGDDVLFLERNDEASAETRAILAELVSETDSGWTGRQHNGARDLRLTRKAYDIMLVLPRD